MNTTANTMIIQEDVCARNERKTAQKTEGMYLEVVRSDALFKDLKEEWDELLEASTSRSVFLSWEWLFHWWMHFGAGKELSLLIVRGSLSGKLCAVAPLLRERVLMTGGIDAKKIRFMGSERVGSDFLDFIALPGKEEGALKLFVDYFAEHPQEWDVIDVSDIEEGSWSIELIKKYAGRQFALFKAPVARCPYIPLPDSYESFLQTLRSNMRSDIRKKTRKIESHKDLSFVIHGEEEDLERKFDELFVLHNKGFRIRSKDKGEKSTFSGEDIKRFHYDIIASFRPKHWIKLFAMYHKQRMIGCLYAFQFKNNVYGYQSGFDRHWDRYSPGTVTAGYCIRESIDGGLSEFHYLRGCEDYKSRWTSKVKRTVSLTVINKTMRGRWYALSVCRVMQLKRWVKHHLLRGKS